MLVYFRTLVLLVFVGVSSGGKKLPSYITKCSRSDPKLSECAIKNANLALPEILKGDKKTNIPNLVPLEIPQIYLSPGRNLKINMTDCKLFGLNHAIIEDMHFDFEKKHCSIVADIHHLNLLSRYDVTGNILVLPISGNGPANITFVGGTYKFEFDYKLVPKRGNQFIQFTNHKLEYKTSRIYIRLDNLFNGDPTLGGEMNRFLDESWKEVSEELYPSLSETISTIISTIAAGFFTKIPMDSIFLP